MSGQSSARRWVIKMSDIVERLRGLASKYDEYGVHSDTELEAATEIEKLREAIDVALQCIEDADVISARQILKRVLGEKE